MREKDFFYAFFLQQSFPSASLDLGYLEAANNNIRTRYVRSAVWQLAIKFMDFLEIIVDPGNILKRELHQI